MPKILDFEMVDHINGDERLSIRDRVIMMVFVISKCRNGELSSIKITDIDHKDRTILIHDTKTRKEKKAPILSKYYPLLTTYLDVRTEHLAHIGGKSDALIINIGARNDKNGNMCYNLSPDGIRQVIYLIAERYGID